MNAFPYLPLGPLPADAHGKRRFRVWAPVPDRIQLAVLRDGKPEVHQLEPEGREYFISQPVPAPGGTRYGFYIGQDQDKLYPDPAGRYQPEGVHGPSEVVDGPSSAGQTFRGHAVDEAVIYELHVGTFTPAGTFDGAIEKLDYLVDLGVNTLEVMPLNQTPGDRNWGYDTVGPFAVFRAYGGPEGLRRFIRAAHERGIAVLIDVIYNHLGPEGNYLPAFMPVFTEEHKTPWGPAINMDRDGADGVRNYYLQNVRMWLDDYGADGLRLDAVHAIKDYSAEHFLEALSKVADEIAERDGRHIILIAECDLNAPRFIRPRAQGGYGLTAQWVDEFHHALHGLLTGESLGYYEDFGRLDHLRRALATGYVYTGQYSKHRGRNFGTADIGDLRPGQLVVFLQNHDQVGNRMVGDRLLETVGVDNYLLGAGTYLLSPFTPLIFMGEEYGEQNPFPYFVHHGDDWLIEAVRKGRAAEFAAFQRPGVTVPDPQGEDTFASAKLSWKVNQRIHAFYRSALTLRARPKNAATLADIAVEREGNCLIWEAHGLRCYANFGEEAVRLPTRARRIALESNGATLTDTHLHLPARGFAALNP